MASVGSQIAARVLEDLEEMAAISAPGAGPGVTRVAYTPEDAAARRWFAERCERYGLRFDVDRLGTCYGWTPGADAGVGKPLLLGSHLDSVPTGGAYDGIVGVMLGLEVARHAAAELPHLPLVAASFACEESTRFGFGTIGSRWLVGDLDVDSGPPPPDRDGRSLAEVLGAARIDELGPVDRRNVHDFRGLVEVHIDQGTLMTSMGARVAVVSAIAGLVRLELIWTGESSHSGGRWREDRRDAVLAASTFVVEANAWWLRVDPEGRRLQLTVGSFTVRPNSPNTVPGEVRLIVDIRSPRQGTLDSGTEDITALAREVARRDRVDVAFRTIGRSDPLEMDRGVSSRLAVSAETAGIEAPEALSLAGHDALVIGRYIPTAMLLIANPSGISHAPTEGLDVRGLEGAAAIIVDALPGIIATTA